MISARTLARVALGGILAFAGASHLTVAREEFRAQVPPWFPADPDAVVVVSGWVEIVLGLALLVVPGRHRWLVGWVVAACGCSSSRSWCSGRCGPRTPGGPGGRAGATDLPPDRVAGSPSRSIIAGLRRSIGLFSRRR